MPLSFQVEEFERITNRFDQKFAVLCESVARFVEASKSTPQVPTEVVLNDTPTPVSPLVSPFRQESSVGQLELGLTTKQSHRLSKKSRRREPSLVPSPPLATMDPNQELCVRLELGLSLKSKKSHLQKSRRPGPSRAPWFQASAEKQYYCGDYRSSVRLFTAAMSVSKEDGVTLVANRAAGLFMVGAYQAAASEYQKILTLVSLSENVPAVSAFVGRYHRFLLNIYACLGLGQSSLKLGDHGAAKVAFEMALRVADGASLFCKMHQPSHLFVEHLKTMAQVRKEASQGLVQAGYLKTFLRKITRIRDIRHIRLDDVNLALSIAPASDALLEKKLNLLVQKQQWQKVAGLCERLAAWNVQLDQVFFGDLAVKHPFPGVSPALYLTCDLIGTPHDEDEWTRACQIESPDAAAEVVLRLPLVAQPFYLRALRLEGRASHAEAAVGGLEQWMKKQGPIVKELFEWLSVERGKLKKALELDKHADRLYDLEDFPEAALKYEECLAIDAMGLAKSFSLHAGGRIHLSWSYNLTRCYMEQDRWTEALDLCNDFLKHYPCCMKSLFSRARCYVHLNRIQEAFDDYSLWLDLARASLHEDLRTSDTFVLGGPYKIATTSVEVVRKEFEHVHEMLESVNVAAVGGINACLEPPMITSDSANENAEEMDSKLPVRCIKNVIDKPHIVSEGLDANFGSLCIPRVTDKPHIVSEELDTKLPALCIPRVTDKALIVSEEMDTKLPALCIPRVTDKALIVSEEMDTMLPAQCMTSVTDTGKPHIISEELDSKLPAQCIYNVKDKVPRVTDKALIVSEDLDTKLPPQCITSVADKPHIISEELDTKLPALCIPRVTDKPHIVLEEMDTKLPALCIPRVTDKALIVSEEMDTKLPALCIPRVTDKALIVSEEMDTKLPAQCMTSVTDKSLIVSKEMDTKLPAQCMTSVTDKPHIISEELETKLPFQCMTSVTDKPHIVSEELDAKVPALCSSRVTDKPHIVSPDVATSVRKDSFWSRALIDVSKIKKDLRC